MNLRRGARAAAVTAGTVGVSWLALRHIGIEATVDALFRASPVWVAVGLVLMSLSLVVRSVAWRTILRAALPGARVRGRDVLRGTSVGVLLSAALPARLGEPARALVVSRRVGGSPREVLPVVAGTIVSQALINVAVLVLLGLVTFLSVGLAGGPGRTLAVVAGVPLAVVSGFLAGPWLLRVGAASRYRRVRVGAGKVRAALAGVRAGLKVFRVPQAATAAVAVQALSWAIQTTSCYLLLVAVGIDDRAGLAAAAAILFAVNVTAAVPVTPSNVGVFQAACVAVLTAGYGIDYPDALAYGILLQAVEFATALMLGIPALIATGSDLPRRSTSRAATP